ncbi:MAG: hypothetical protein IPL61_09155 [Myxococcales bacterium]|nr:hypothetical protein [Myxococcales bacterium]
MSDDRLAGYPARYRDAHGGEDTAITNDGATLRMVVRGVAWSGRDFDTLSPAPETPADRLASFAVHDGCLCQCEIACDIPQTVVDADGASAATLTLELGLGAPAHNGGIDDVRVRLTLAWARGRVAGSGRSGWFEDELLEIQRQLPVGAYVRACINCLYADYSPSGHGLFGDMACFRNVKAEYLAVRSKKAFWPVLARAERSVQETYHCDEFARRVAGTGYRG